MKIKVLLLVDLPPRRLILVVQHNEQLLAHDDTLSVHAFVFVAEDVHLLFEFAQGFFGVEDQHAGVGLRQAEFLYFLQVAV